MNFVYEEYLNTGLFIRGNPTIKADLKARQEIPAACFGANVNPQWGRSNLKSKQTSLF